MAKMIFNRKALRLPDYNYSQPGIYFITVCTHNKECLFGKIHYGEMHLNTFGYIVQEEWHNSVELLSISFDLYVVMPNHFHGLVVIEKNASGIDLATVMRSFKSAVTKKINELRKTPGAKLWQSRYYDHVVRDDADLQRIRQYIQENPLKWELDRLYIPS